MAGRRRRTTGGAPVPPSQPQHDPARPTSGPPEALEADVHEVDQLPIEQSEKRTAELNPQLLSDSADQRQPAAETEPSSLSALIDQLVDGSEQQAPEAPAPEASAPSVPAAGASGAARQTSPPPAAAQPPAPAPPPSPAAPAPTADPAPAATPAQAAPSGTAAAPQPSPPPATMQQRPQAPAPPPSAAPHTEPGSAQIPGPPAAPPFAPANSAPEAIEPAPAAPPQPPVAREDARGQGDEMASADDETLMLDGDQLFADPEARVDAPQQPEQRPAAAPEGHPGGDPDDDEPEFDLEFEEPADANDDEPGTDEHLQTGLSSDQTLWEKVLSEEEPIIDEAAGSSEGRTGSAVDEPDAGREMPSPAAQQMSAAAAAAGAERPRQLPPAPPSPEEQAARAEDQKPRRYVAVREAYLDGPNALPIALDFEDEVDEINHALSAFSSMQHGQTGFLRFSLRLRPEAKGESAEWISMRKRGEEPQAKDTRAKIGQWVRYIGSLLFFHALRKPDDPRPAPTPPNKRGQSTKPLPSSQVSDEEKQSWQAAERKQRDTAHFEVRLSAGLIGAREDNEDLERQVEEVCAGFYPFNTPYQEIVWKRGDPYGSLLGLMGASAPKQIPMMLCAEEVAGLAHVPDDLTRPHGIMVKRSNFKQLPPSSPITIEDPLKPDDGKISLGEVNPGSEDAEVVGMYNSQLDQHMVVVGRTGSGKALALDTPIPTPDGMRQMGELEIGDLVFGSNGMPTEIIAATQVMDDRPCYELEMSDGERVVADAEHLWVVGTTPPGKEPTVPRQMTTAELALIPADTRRWITLPEAAGYSFRDDLPEPPSSFARRIKDGDVSSIPASYLEGSINQRVQLLAALAGRRLLPGPLAITTEHEQLARDLRRLCFSLGLNPQLRHDGERGWTLSSSFEWPPHPGSQAREIAAVRPVDSVPVRCIQVASADGIFLVGETYLQTHNSVLLTHLVYGVSRADYPIVIVDPHGELSDDVLKTLIVNHPERTDDIIFADMSAGQYPVAFNPLDIQRRIQIEPTVDSVGEMLSSYMRLDASSSPRAVEFTRQAITALCHANLVLEDPHTKCTLLDVTPFFTQEQFRQLIVQFCDNDTVRQNFDPDTGIYEQATDKERVNISMPIVRAFSKLGSSDSFSAVFNSPQNKLNLGRLIGKNKIIIVKLATASYQKKLGEFVGSLILPWLLASMDDWGRHKDEITGEAIGTGARLFVDEAPTLFGPESSVPEALAQVRKWDLGMVTICQNLAQFPKNVSEALLANTASKVTLASDPNVSGQIAKAVAGASNIITSADVAQLPNYHAYMNVLLPAPGGGLTTSGPFSVRCLPPMEAKMTAEQEQRRARVIERSRDVVCNQIDEVKGGQLRRLEKIMQSLQSKVAERTDEEYRPPELDGGSAGFDSNSGWY